MLIPASSKEKTFIPRQLHDSHTMAEHPSFTLAGLRKCQTVIGLARIY